MFELLFFCQKNYALEVNDSRRESLLAEECDTVIKRIILVLFVELDINAALAPNLDSLASRDESGALGYLGGCKD